MTLCKSDEVLKCLCFSIMSCLEKLFVVVVFTHFMLHDFDFHFFKRKATQKRENKLWQIEKRNTHTGTISGNQESGHQIFNHVCHLRKLQLSCIILFSPKCAPGKMIVSARVPWPACGRSDVSDPAVLDGRHGFRPGLEVLHTHQQFHAVLCSRPGL